MPNTICSSCGHNNTNDVFFCTECGQILKKDLFTNADIYAAVVKNIKRIRENLLYLDKYYQKNETYLRKAEKLRALMQLPELNADKNLSQANQLEGFPRFCKTASESEIDAAYKDLINKLTDVAIQAKSKVSGNIDSLNTKKNTWEEAALKLKEPKKPEEINTKDLDQLKGMLESILVKIDMASRQRVDNAVKTVYKPLNEISGELTARPDSPVKWADICNAALYGYGDMSYELEKLKNLIKNVASKRADKVANVLKSDIDTFMTLSQLKQSNGDNYYSMLLHSMSYLIKFCYNSSFDIYLYDIQKENDALISRVKNFVDDDVVKIIDRRITVQDPELHSIAAEDYSAKRWERFFYLKKEIIENALPALKTKIRASLEKQKAMYSAPINAMLEAIKNEKINRIKKVHEANEQNNHPTEKVEIDLGDYEQTMIKQMYKYDLCEILLETLEE